MKYFIGDRRECAFNRVSLPVPPFQGIYWNDHENLEKTPLAARLLFAGQLDVENYIRQIAGFEMFSLSLLTEIHRVMFESVWPEFAGKLRGREANQIPLNVSIGNVALGVSLEHVPFETQRLVSDITKAIQDLDHKQSFWSPELTVRSARSIAAYLHCELIRIHPFVNGNGRTSRACVNYIGQRYGLPFFVVREDEREDYYEANRTYLRPPKRSQHFADFLERYWTV